MNAANSSIADQAINETIGRALAKYPHHTDRIRRAAALLEIDAVTPLGGGSYSVRSATNATESYLVILHEGKYPTCGCKDFERRGKGCKHQWAAHLFSVAALRYAVLVERAASAPLPGEWTPEETARLAFSRWLVAHGVIGEE